MNHRPGRRHSRQNRVFAWMLVALWTGIGLGCVPPGGARGPARPTDPDADVLFTSLRDARTKMNARVPTWVSALEPLARDGALQLAKGGLGRLVVHDIASKAANGFGHNVSVWWFITDNLRGVDWPPELLSGRSLLVSLGVALMQTTAPGRYAVVVILPEPGMGMSG